MIVSGIKSIVMYPVAINPRTGTYNVTVSGFTHSEEMISAIIRVEGCTTNKMI